MLRSSLRSLFSLALLASFVTLVSPQQAVAQQWLPAGQMVGPLMWQFPLSLPDGTHLIGLRWVNETRNDSLYWFDIASFMTEPRMYERQTPELKYIEGIGDYDGNGIQDMFGRRHDGPRSYFMFNVFSPEAYSFGFEQGVNVPNTKEDLAYQGDVNGDGFGDDWRSTYITYGDSSEPFRSASYVQLHDNSNPLYPDLKPTIVAALGMMGGKPCIVQSYQTAPDRPPIYELHELNMEDLRARAPSIRTTMLQRLQVGEAIRYGYVVLRTPDVWWLFDPRSGTDGGYGMKITHEEITIMPVPEFWHGYWEQYFGQGGVNGEYNFPRVMDGDRPLVKADYIDRDVESIGSTRHVVYRYAKVVDSENAAVEILGSAYPSDPQCRKAYPDRLVVVPDVDGDGIEDLMTFTWFDVNSAGDQLPAISLYATSQRPTVSVPEEGFPDTTMIAVVDEGVHWRLLAAAGCSTMLPETLGLYDVSGGQVAQSRPVAEGPDILLVKPAGLPSVALWARLGICSFRLQ